MAPISTTGLKSTVERLLRILGPLGSGPPPAPTPLFGMESLRGCFRMEGRRRVVSAWSSCSTLPGDGGRAIATGAAAAAGSMVAAFGATAGELALSGLVGLSTPEVELSTPEVELSTPEVELSTPEVGLRPSAVGLTAEAPAPYR
ncbi:hypothetical protein V5799_026869 [Amblyomma americanum]|uniref:Uncharacterized protein n=1 Tax=Amblyomma americanum TaxID=6943 RepID=A0AAQ4DHD2_AMBAM